MSDEHTQMYFISTSLHISKIGYISITYISNIFPSRTFLKNNSSKKIILNCFIHVLLF